MRVCRKKSKYSRKKVCYNRRKGRRKRKGSRGRRRHRRAPRRSGLHRRGRRKTLKCTTVASMQSAESLAAAFKRRGKRAEAVSIGGTPKVCHS